jgi:hypothetical protein
MSFNGSGNDQITLRDEYRGVGEVIGRSGRGNTMWDGWEIGGKSGEHRKGPETSTFDANDCSMTRILNGQDESDR